MSCPAPVTSKERVLLGHGSGGRLSAELTREVFLPALGNALLARLEDQATLQVGAARLAFTTDSFVVRPLFFRGGDIGSLAVHGTVNDLAAGGARPLFLSAAFIIEEGFATADLRRVAQSLGDAAAAAGVTVACADTKVVERGAADGLFLNTSGIGEVRAGVALSAANARPGDAVLLSGTAGDHGIAIMAQREGLEFDCAIESDSAPLHGLTAAMLDATLDIHAMRDPTRGGLASALNEIAAASRVGVEIDEDAVPVRREVRAACEMLGLDPLYVANEGKMAAFVPDAVAPAVLAAMRAHPLGRDAAVIGRVTAEHAGQVVVRTRYGTRRILHMLAGDQLPRIC